jgi:hypothetical protein
MAKRITLAWLALACVGTAWAAPLNLQSIPRSARWVLHIDGQAFWASQLGQHILSGLDANDQTKRNAVKELIGSDVIEDLHGITLYGPSPDEKQAVTLVQGNFAAKKILSLIALSPGYSVSSLGQRDVYQWRSEKDQKGYHGTFVNPHLIAISQSGSALEQALDALEAAPEPDAPRETFPMITGAPDSAFILACAKDLDQLSQGNGHAAILRDARVLAFIGYEDGGQLTLTVQLVTLSNETANQVEQMLQGLLAFARLQQNQHPEIVPFLDSLALTSEGNGVRLKLQHPSAAVYEWIQKDAKKKVHESLEALP